MDKDPKVSGKISVRGYAYDDTMLTSLKLKFDGFKFKTSAGEEIELAKYADGKWTYPATSTIDGTLGWNFTLSDTDGPSQAGHFVEWQLDLDTSKIANVADVNKVLTIVASDGTNSSTASSVQTGSVTTTVYATDGQAEQSHFYASAKDAYEKGTTYAQVPGKASSNALTKGSEDSSYTGVYAYTYNVSDYYKMDVVPYITKLETKNRLKSGLKNNNIRAASGKYSIMKGSTSDFITVSGFNLSPNAVQLVSSTKLSGTVTTSTGIALTYANGSTTDSFTVSNDISKSGYLEVFTNGIRALNNINNNDAKGSYSFTGTDGTAQVSDYKEMPNREADYYTTKNVRLTDDRYLRVFDMKETPIKNGYYPTMLMHDDNPVFGYIDLNGFNETYESTSVPSTGTFGYIRGCYQTQKAEFEADTGALKDGNIDYMFGTISADQVGFAKDSAGKYYYASVYNYSGAHMSVVYDSYAENHTWTYNYYPRTTYRDGWGDGTGYNGYSGDFVNNTNNNAISLEATDFGDSLLIGRYQNIRMLAKEDSTSSDGASVYMAYYDDNTTDKNIIFRTFKIGKNSNWSNPMGNSIYSNLSERDTSGRISVGSNASSYLDLGVTSDNHVVIAYYDLSSACLKLKYSSDTIDGSNTTPSVSWTESVINFPDYVGSYVSIAIDSKNHIHIAAFDTSDSDLMYFYLDKYDSTTCLQERIDQANSVGQWTRIALNSTDIPYIAYYNSTETGSRESIKLAYADSIGANTTAGVDSNGYTTGSWEYMTIPAINPPQGGDSKFKNVNLGFDSAGTPVVGYLGTNIEFGKWLSE
jgi:large repetitive protein